MGCQPILSGLSPHCQLYRQRRLRIPLQFAKSQRSSHWRNPSMLVFGCTLQCIVLPGQDFELFIERFNGRSCQTSGQPQIQESFGRLLIRNFVDFHRSWSNNYSTIKFDLHFHFDTNGWHGIRRARDLLSDVFGLQYWDNLYKYVGGLNSKWQR